jgi:hypothetical protein
MFPFPLTYVHFYQTGFTPFKQEFKSISPQLNKSTKAFNGAGGAGGAGRIIRIVWIFFAFSE